VGRSVTIIVMPRMAMQKIDSNKIVMLRAEGGVGVGVGAGAGELALDLDPASSSFPTGFSLSPLYMFVHIMMNHMRLN